jgi:hypothetical protein
MPSVDIEELGDEHEARNDFRRANGAPLVSDPDNPEKSLRYRRPSSYAKLLDDESALTEWRIWRSMTGVARSQALAAKVAVCKDEDKAEKKVLRDEAADKGSANEAADTGTALHAMTARIEDQADTGFDPPDQYADDLDAYTNFLCEFGLVSEMTEVHMVNDAYRAAGTADRIYKTTRPLLLPSGAVMEPGTLILADLKTGKKLDFSLPGYCVQLALYADGTLYDVLTERRLPTPPIDRSWALLVHLPVGQAKCTPLWVSVDLGLKGALLAFDVNEWRNAWKAGRDGHDAFPVEVVPDTGIGPEIHMPGEDDMHFEMLEFIKLRITVIRSHDKAKDRLFREWPAGVPTPKQGLSDEAHIDKVLKLLDSIEAEYSLPFQNDPRVLAGVHKSEIAVR